MSRRFVKFVVAGLAAAAVNIGSRVVLSLFIPYSAAIVAAYIIAMAVAFTLYKLFVFEKSGRSSHGESFRFVVVNMVALVQVWLVSEALVRFVFPWIGWRWHAETVAHTIGVATPIFTSYLGHKHFSFAARPASP